MKKVFVFGACLFLGIRADCQVRFNERFNFDYADAGYGVKNVSGGFLITGPIINIDSGISSGRIQAFKIDTLGNVVHYQNYSHQPDWYYPGWEGNLVACANGSFAMLGAIEDTTGDSDFLLYRLNFQGDSIWTKRINDPYYSIARNLCVSADGGFALVGQWDSAATTQLDIIMRKTDSLGNIQWQHYFNQTWYDDAFSVIQTKDGGYLIGGYSISNTSTFGNALVIKTDSAGNEQWRKIMGNQYDQGIVDILETQDSNFVVTGPWQVYNATTHCCDPLGYKFSIIKLDKDSGTTIWHKLYGDTLTDKGFRSVIELNDGSLVCAGVKSIVITPNNVPAFGTIYKFSATGDSLWERNYLPPLVVNGHGFLNDIISTSDGGFIAVGVAGGDTLTQDTWILKVDSEGCEVWNCLASGISEQTTKELSFTAYPNPVSGNQIQFEFSESIKQEALLQILGITGELIFQRQINKGITRVELSVTDYSSGLYFARVTGKDLSLQTKFMVVRE